MALLRVFARTRVNRGRQGLSRIWWVIAGLVFSGVLDSPAQTAPAPEYQLKAVFLFNFTQFVEWPTNAFPETRTPLVIGVLGEDPFGAYLDETVRGEKVNDRPLVVQRYHRVEEIKACHVLFISRSEREKLELIFANLKGRNILTVGDAVRCAQRDATMRILA